MLGTLPKKHIQAQRERLNYILLARGRMGTLGCVNKRAWIQELTVTWSVRETLTLLSYHEDIEESDDGQRRGTNKRRSSGIY